MTGREATPKIVREWSSWSLLVYKSAGNGICGLRLGSAVDAVGMKLWERRKCRSPLRTFSLVVAENCHNITSLSERATFSECCPTATVA